MPKKAKPGKTGKKGKIRKAGKRKKAKPAKKKEYTRNDFERLKMWYKAEIEEKDKLIERLKRENIILLSTALKQGAKTREIFEKAKKEILKKK